MSFSVFDEASVTEWKGQDLKLADQIPNIDILVIAVKRVRIAISVTLPYNKFLWTSLFLLSVLSGVC